MDQTREDRMRQRMRGAARHQVQNADFGDLFTLAIPTTKPEVDPDTGSSESPADPDPEPTPVPVPVKRTSPNTSAKRRRLNSEAPIAPVQTHVPPLPIQTSSANRSSRRALRAPAQPDPYDLENAPSTVQEDGGDEEQIGQDDATSETTPQSRASTKRVPISARSATSTLAAHNHAPAQSSSLKSLRGEEVTESPADEPGSGHRRRLQESGAVTSSALLQSALRSVDSDTGHGHMQSSSPLSRKSRTNTTGMLASTSSHRTGLRRSTRLSGSPDDEVNEVSSDPPTTALREADGARVSSEDLAQQGGAPEVAETMIEESSIRADEAAEEAQEINDADAALHLGRKRLRRPEPALSPKPSLDSPDEPVGKRPRKAPLAKKKSPAKQRQPKAPRAKARKPAAQRKSRDGDTAGAVAIKIQRFTKPRPRADGDSSDEDPLNSTIPFASRSSVNAVDVFAQMCEEIMSKSVENIKETMRSAPDLAAKKESRVKLLALQAFREEVRTRLLEHTIALDSLLALKKRVRETQKEKVKLRERIIEIRAEREQVQLRMDAVRIKHDEDSKEALHNINLSAAMHDVDLAIEQGRAAPDLSAKEQKTADLANLELLISRVAEQACSNGPGGGALKQIKAFNAFLERAAAVL